MRNTHSMFENHGAISSLQAFSSSFPKDKKHTCRVDSRQTLCQNKTHFMFLMCIWNIFDLFYIRAVIDCQQALGISWFTLVKQSSYTYKCLYPDS